MSKEEKAVDLVKESHDVVREIAKAGKSIADGTMKPEVAGLVVAMFDARTRAINTAIHAEDMARKS